MKMILLEFCLGVFSPKNEIYKEPTFFFFFFSFYFLKICWRLITLQYCSDLEPTFYFIFQYGNPFY